MKKYLLGFVVLFFYKIASSQDIRCKEDKTFEYINDSRTDPYKKYCRIYVTRKKIFGKTTKKSTGVVIAPNAVLTAGHTVWNPRNKIIKIKIVPAENAGEAPFGSITYQIDQIRFIRSAPGYIGKAGQVDVDYGIIIFPDTAVSRLTDGFISINNFDSLKNNIDSIALIGYPRTTQMTLRKGHINRFHEEEQRLYYDLFTNKGDSGGGLTTRVNQKYFIVGIHNNGNLNKNKCNAGTKINDAVFNQIMNWLRRNQPD